MDVARMLRVFSLTMLGACMLCVAAYLSGGTHVRPAEAAGTAVIFLTSGSSWTVPADWDSLNNTIEVIGGGASGGATYPNAVGGGGGAYAKITGATFSPGVTITYHVGEAGSGGSSGGDTYLCAGTTGCSSISGSGVIVGAKGGGAHSGATPGKGGAAASSVGSTKYSGGNGGTATGECGGGGGGAAGPNGNGANGGKCLPGQAGAGGGGANGGAVGGNGSGATAGRGGNGRDGSGGGAPGGGDGSAGGGGGGATFASLSTGGKGGQDTIWVQTSNGAAAGPGGGGGGAQTQDGDGGRGGGYGGGAGGSRSANSIAGAPGIIVITYQTSSDVSGATGPRCSVTFDKNPVADGEGTTIRWSSSGGEWMYINNIGYVNSSGSATVQPTHTVDYGGSIGHTSTSAPGGGEGTSQTFTTPGTHTFTVPSYTSLTVEVWGGGGAGGANGQRGGSGGQSNFGNLLLANGGTGGSYFFSASQGTPVFGGEGQGGTASGGAANITGNPGIEVSPRCGEQPLGPSDGGSSPHGGAGGSWGDWRNPNPGSTTGGTIYGYTYGPAPGFGEAPGGGGGGVCACGCSGGGGGGGYATRTYAAGELSPGSTVNVVVGTGGEQGAKMLMMPGGAGAPGKVRVIWTPADGTSGTTDVTDAICPATLTVGSDCPVGQHLSGASCLCDSTDSPPVGGMCAGSCPAGQSWDGMQCVALMCPSGYALQDGACVSVNTCPAFYCVGSDLYQNDASCHGTFSETCAYGCAGHSCVATPHAGGSLTATPSVVRSGTSATVRWTTQHVQTGTCSVFASGLVDALSHAASGSLVSAPITEQTTFRLLCTDLFGAPFVRTATVSLLPFFQEK